jgi:hypothetical protein
LVPDSITCPDLKKKVQRVAHWTVTFQEFLDAATYEHAACLE